jgi:hypothetical protein
VRIFVCEIREDEEEREVMTVMILCGVRKKVQRCSGVKESDALVKGKGKIKGCLEDSGK